MDTISRLDGGIDHNQKQIYVRKKVNIKFIHNNGTSE